MLDLHNLDTETDPIAVVCLNQGSAFHALHSLLQLFQLCVAACSESAGKRLNRAHNCRPHALIAINLGGFDTRERLPFREVAHGNEHCDYAGLLIVPLDLISIFVFDGNGAPLLCLVRGLFSSILLQSS